jgi:zinc protease
MHYEKYIKGKNYVATSFVPKGQANLILEGSTVAAVKSKKNNRRKEDTFDAIAATYKKTPSTFDRSVEPWPESRCKITSGMENKLSSDQRIGN